MKIMTLLITTLLLVSCATVNHGTTVDAGKSQLTIGPKIFLGDMIAVVTDYRFGVTNDFNLGLDNVTRSNLTKLAPETVFELYGLYNFRTGYLNIVSGLGAQLSRAYGDNGVQDGYYLLPTVSLALSKGFAGFTPYLGAQYNVPGGADLYVGSEFKAGNSITSVQFDAGTSGVSVSGSFGFQF